MFSEDIKDRDGNVLVKKNHMITPSRAAKILGKGVDEKGDPIEKVKIRNILCCKQFVTRLEFGAVRDLDAGTVRDQIELDDINEQLTAEGKQPAEYKDVILGITKAALATSSFLSAASFQGYP